MKKCACCGVESPLDAPSCSVCGEASWAWIGIDPTPPVSAPKPAKKTKKDEG